MTEAPAQPNPPLMTDSHDSSRVFKEHCNTCLGWKNHDVVHEERTRWQEEIDEGNGIYIEGGHVWTMYRCRGCDDVRMQHAHWFSEDIDPDGRPIVHREWYPPSVARQKPKWLRSGFPFNAKLQAFEPLLAEIYGALSIGAHGLAAMGVRALAEQVMVEAVGEQGTFKATTEAFFAAGYVAPLQQSSFEGTLIEAGHAAMHRDFTPSADGIETLLDILEGTMARIYHEPMLAEALKKAIPPRRGRRDRPPSNGGDGSDG